MDSAALLDSLSGERLDGCGIADVAGEKKAVAMTLTFDPFSMNIRRGNRDSQNADYSLSCFLLGVVAKEIDICYFSLFFARRRGGMLALRISSTPLTFYEVLHIVSTLIFGRTTSNSFVVPNPAWVWKVDN